MRTRISDDDVLEPLPVYDDGVPVVPVPTATEGAGVDPRELARECIDAVRAVFDERVTVRAQTPWVATAPAVPPPVLKGEFAATFIRMFGLDPSRLAALPAWWQRRAEGGRVDVARRLLLDAPRQDAHGTWRLRGRLRSPGRARAIPVELLLWPHLGAWTKMTLEPQRRVLCGRRYFRSGHRVLDRLTAELECLEPDAPCRGASAPNM